VPDLDRGIRKLDEAKTALGEALAAIQDLSQTADKNKRDTQAALVELQELQTNNGALEAQLAQVKAIASFDIETFRMLAGTSRAQIRRGLILAFVIGVFSQSSRAQFGQPGIGYGCDMRSREEIRAARVCQRCV